VNNAESKLSYRIAYEEAVRALSQQQTMIDGLRARAGLLLSAAAVTTSFLGAQALRHGAPSFATWFALACFVGLSIAALAVLWPRRLEFTADPSNVIENCIESERPHTGAEIHRNLSLHMHDSYAENCAGYRPLALHFRLASALLTAEVLFWLIDLASTA
jgi:hypothetical protein